MKTGSTSASGDLADAGAEPAVRVDSVILRGSCRRKVRSPDKLARASTAQK